MRIAQFQILTKILEKIEIPDYVFAFEKMKSIPEMAAKHVGKNIVLSVDLEDFFHSIKQSKLYEILTTQLGIAEKPARTISELATFKSFVPQGGLTSPKVANIVTAATFGPDIKEYCDNHNIEVTIYADDVTMSTNEEINVSQVLSDITGIIRRNGFRINLDKTKVMYKGNRQYVCGVVVNSKTNLIAKERRRLRAIVHNITMYGVEHEAEKNSKTPEEFLNHIRGRLNWFRQLNPVVGGRYFNQLQDYLKSVSAIKQELLKEKSLLPEIKPVEVTNPELVKVLEEMALVHENEQVESPF